ncbi:hypothetical protein D3C73_651430 [compost metagenome]
MVTTNNNYTFIVLRMGIFQECLGKINIILHNQNYLIAFYNRIPIIGNLLRDPNRDRIIGIFFNNLNDLFYFRRYLLNQLLLLGQ